MPFEVDRRRVVHETIDGEAILIHMETGFYYSLEGSGSEIWNALAAGTAPEDICGALKAHYAAPEATIEAAVAALVDELCREGLLDEVGTASPGTPLATAPASAANGNGGPAEFQAPVLHRYTDMADFMLVDPIHEVEDTGWPNQKVAP
jgi:hypothetical protein